MNAVILAAGIGSRLKGQLGDKPKCMVQVNGRTILDWQLQALLRAGVRSVFIVTGYQADIIKCHVADAYAHCVGVDFTFVDNEEFESTNNMYSLWLALRQVGRQPFLLMNADVVFDSHLPSRLIELAETAICVDIGSYAEESMKVAIDPDTGRLTRISKGMSPHESFGCSIDLYYFDVVGASRIATRVEQIVQGQQRRNDWTEVAIDELLRSGRLHAVPLDIQQAKWYEIDTLEDLIRAETVFGQGNEYWSDVHLAFVDMDGTLYRGKRLIDGASTFVRELQRRVPHVYFLSNNSSRAPSDYMRILAGHGIPTSESQILISSLGLIDYLRQREWSRVFLVGTPALEGLLNLHGIRHDVESPQAVVIGFDTTLTYDKVRHCALLLNSGEIPYLATHKDIVCPTENGNIPDIGCLIALLETATGRTPDKTFGKPDASMVQFVYERLQVLPRQSVFVGDRTYTDYEMATACGGRFIGVLTGESSRADFESCDDLLVFPSVADIFPDEAMVDTTTREGSRGCAGYAA